MMQSIDACSCAICSLFDLICFDLIVLLVCLQSVCCLFSFDGVEFVGRVFAMNVVDFWILI